MASQELKVWSEELVVDGLTNITQRRDLLDEEFLNGWLRKMSISSQQLNQLFYLLSIHANPFPNAPVPYPTSLGIPDTALEMNGQAILEADYPNAFSIYGATLTDITADAPTGFTYIIRKS